MRVFERLEPGDCAFPEAERAQDQHISGKVSCNDCLSWTGPAALAGSWPESGDFLFLACDLAAMEARHKLRGLATNF